MVTRRKKKEERRRIGEGEGEGRGGRAAVNGNGITSLQSPLLRALDPADEYPP
jgi:hypothetical protein